MSREKSRIVMYGQWVRQTLGWAKESRAKEQELNRSGKYGRARRARATAKAELAAACNHRNSLDWLTEDALGEALWQLKGGQA